MNVEKTLPKIVIQKEETKELSKYDKFYQEFYELDRDVMELVKVIAFKEKGYLIPQSLFDGYSKMIENLDQIKALNIKKSKYEDLEDCFRDLENIYFELEEIDDKCMEEPIFIEDEIVKPQTEEVINITEKN